MHAVVSIGLFWFYFVVFSYNGVYSFDQFSSKHSEQLSDSNTLFLRILPTYLINRNFLFGLPFKKSRPMKCYFSSPLEPFLTHYDITKRKLYTFFFVCVLFISFSLYFLVYSIVQKRTKSERNNPIETADAGSIHTCWKYFCLIKNDIRHIH